MIVINPGNTSALTLIEAKSNTAGVVASFDFTSIPYYNYYILFLQGKADSADRTVRMTFNADGGANYDSSRFLQLNTVVSGAVWAADTYGHIGSVTNTGTLVTVQATISNCVIDQYKCVSATSSAGIIGNAIYGVNWKNTAAFINQITLTLDAGNYAQYTKVKLYGVS